MQLKIIPVPNPRNLLMNMEKTGVLFLAAGKGTRMHSNRPKVLQEIIGEPMLAYVYRAVEPLFSGRVWTMIGHRGDMVREAFSQREGHFIVQEPLLGTGHALQMAWPHLQKAGLENVLVISGDVPLLSTNLLQTFLNQMQAENSPLGFITLTLPASGAYGRVVRKNGAAVGIVEAKDYDATVHGADRGEINTGVYLFNVAKITPLLSQLTNNNKSGEYYITDLVGLGVEAGYSIVGAACGDESLLGVNNPAELAAAENALLGKIRAHWLASGVSIHFAESVVLGSEVTLEPGAQISGPCHIYGQTHVEAGAVIEPFCMIKNSRIAKEARVRAFSHLEDAVVGEACVVGPYARLRPGAVLEESARVGNFVELKKATLRKGAKANHLTYVGDAIVGEGANLGAGTITCNYDGKNKFKTEIGAGAFIGSNSALVAPVKIGANSLVAAGSVITKDVPDNAMAFARARQVNREEK